MKLESGKRIRVRKTLKTWGNHYYIIHGAQGLGEKWGKWDALIRMIDCFFIGSWYHVYMGHLLQDGIFAQ
jgi:hypothetical protein